MTARGGVKPSSGQGGDCARWLGSAGSVGWVGPLRLLLCLLRCWAAYGQDGEKCSWYLLRAGLLPFLLWL